MEEKEKEKAIFIASHGGRMRCIVNELINNYEYNGKNLELANCSYILIKQDGEKISLKIFSNNHEEINKEINEKINEKINKNNEEIKTSLSNILLYYKYIFIIRHGEGTHNLNKNKDVSTIKAWNKKLLKKDHYLTSKGVNDARTFASSFKTINEYKNIDLDSSLYFSSILYRTIQTIAIIMTIFKVNNNIIVLPYNHELLPNLVKNSKKCQSNKEQFITIGENKKKYKGKIITEKHLKFARPFVVYNEKLYSLNNCISYTIYDEYMTNNKKKKYKNIFSVINENFINKNKNITTNCETDFLSTINSIEVQNGGKLEKYIKNIKNNNLEYKYFDKLEYGLRVQYLKLLSMV